MVQLIQYGKAERVSKDKVVFRHHDNTVVIGKAAVGGKVRCKGREKDSEKQTASYKVVTVIASGAANAPTNSKGSL